MILSPEQSKTLNGALLSAFNHDSLAHMLQYELGQSLDHIASNSGNLRNIVFDVVQWAEQHGRLEDLVKGARETNSGNPELIDWINENINILNSPNLVDQPGDESGDDDSLTLDWFEELFVNRQRQLDDLDRLISNKTKQFMIVKAGKDMGKSWLILKLKDAAEAKDPEPIPQVVWEFNHQSKDYVSLIVQARDVLATESGKDFDKVNKLINDGTLSTIHNDKKLLNQHQHRITDEFVSTLGRLSKEQKILFLLDDFEKATQFTQKWIIDLLTRICNKKFVNILVVIAAREAPRFDIVIRKVTHRTQLSSFGPEHVHELLESIKVICPNVNFSSNAEELYHSTNGHPGKLGNELDKILIHQYGEDEPMDWIDLDY